MAFDTSVAATVESTPPLMAQIARPVADLLPDPSDRAFYKRAHRPGTMTTADIKNESPQQAFHYVCA
jgi:hypothetical protein